MKFDSFYTFSHRENFINSYLNLKLKVVLSKLPIGDVATQYFADREMFCAGRVAEMDLKRTMKACGGSIVVSIYNYIFDNKYISR